jgi:hypothetical protein
MLAREFDCVVLGTASLRPILDLCRPNLYESSDSRDRVRINCRIGPIREEGRGEALLH